MKGLKSLAVTSLTLALLAKGAVVSHAVAFTIFVENVDPTANATRYTGDPTANDFSTLYANPGGIQTSSGIPYHTVFAPDTPAFSPHVYTTPTVIRYGQVQTVGPVIPGLSGTYTNVPAAFDFALEDGADPGALQPTTSFFDQFLVKGTLNGTLGTDANGIPFSTAAYSIDSVEDRSPSPTQVLATSSVDPKNGQAAWFIEEKIGGHLYDIWLDKTVSLPAIGTDPLTLSGFVTTADVPEPGSIGMLIGLGVSGSLLLRRRNRRA